MDTYRDFAAVYDSFMEDIPYDSWALIIIEKLRAAGIGDGLLCELGCGTGNMTERLAAAGYDMIGIDASEEMLTVAQKKELLRKHPDLREIPDEEKKVSFPEAEPAGKISSCEDILYLQQDMREFELYGTVRAVISVCDSLNYILEEADLLQVFRLVNNYLDPGGIFLFDLHTPAYYEEIGDQTIAENRPEGSFIWENYYDPDTRINQYDLTLFLPVSGVSGEPLYVRREETHLERGWTAEEIRDLLHRAGLACEQVIPAYRDEAEKRELTEEELNGEERLFFVARERQKGPDGISVPLTVFSSAGDEKPDK